MGGVREGCVLFVMHFSQSKNAHLLNFIKYVATVRWCQCYSHYCHYNNKSPCSSIPYTYRYIIGSIWVPSDKVHWVGILQFFVPVLVHFVNKCATAFDPVRSIMKAVSVDILESENKVKIRGVLLFLQNV